MSQFLFISAPADQLLKIREQYSSSIKSSALSLQELTTESGDHPHPCLIFTDCLSPGDQTHCLTRTQYSSLNASVGVGICFLSNITELSKNLTPSRNETGKEERNDTTLIAEAEAQWGPHHDSRLKGQFVYILFNQMTGDLHAALSAFSGRQLFVYESSSMIAISNHARLLAELTHLTPAADALSGWLAGQPNPHHSLFQQLRTIPPGCYLRSERSGGLRIKKFWDIDANNRLVLPRALDYQEHFHALLSREVEDCLTPLQGPVCSQMSGGLDSTSITALAAKIAARQQRDLHTLSHRYRHTASCDESPLIDMMNHHLQPTRSHDIELDSYADMTFAQLYPTDLDGPGIVRSPKYLQELHLIRSLGARVLLTGNGGDETCWGHSATYTNRLFQGDWTVLPEVYQACRQIAQPVWPTLQHLFVKPLLRQMLPGALLKLANYLRGRPDAQGSSAPPWLTSHACDLRDAESSSSLFPNPFSARREPARHARYHSIHNTSTYNSMRSYQGLADPLGITVHHPFFSKSVVEFSFVVPEKLLIQGAYPKWLLRHSMAGLLPDAVRWNTHKTVFDQHFARLVHNNADEIRGLLAHPGLADIGLVDNKRALQAFEDVAGAGGGSLNVDLLYLILTQAWFQSYCV